MGEQQHATNESILKKDGKFSRYLSARLGRPTRVSNISPLGTGEHGEAFKITTTGGSTFILKRFKESGRNLTFTEDRIREAFLSKRTSNLLPHHVKVHDILTISHDGKRALSLPECEPYILMEEATGQDYSNDLNAIAKRNALTEIDHEKLSLITHSLADVHSIKGDPAVYQRYIKDWYGYGVLELCNELRQSYPEPIIKELKQGFLSFEHRLAPHTDRCRAIHGEFFPGTIRFDGKHLHTYDSRRFGYGEPADDYGSFVFNLALTSILHHGKIKEPFTSMIKTFMSDYQARIPDTDMDWIILPFMAYRALIVANPKIVPLEKIDSARVLKFCRTLLKQKRFNLDKIAKIA